MNAYYRIHFLIIIFTYGFIIACCHLQYVVIKYIYIAINKVTLLGRVGADPQKRGTDEHPVVVFSLATHQNFINNNEGCTFLFNLFEHVFVIVV